MSGSGKEQLKGAKKAAMLLLSMSKEEAAKVLSYMDDKMIEEIVLEMSRIKSISKTDKEEVLKEFKSTMDKVAFEARGGVDKAKEILSKSLGKDKAEDILQKVNKRDVTKDFEFLNEIDSHTISVILGKEAPQTIAVTLSYINPKKAAEVLKQFPKEVQSQIAIKMAMTSKTHPEAVAEIAKVIRKKYESRDKSEFTSAGGAESLAGILNHIDKSLEDQILKELTDKAPELAHKVKEKLYSFEDLLNLTNKEMRILINRLNGNDLLVAALRAAGDELRQHFFNSMSQNRAADIIEEMEARGKITLREINLARAEIINIARGLEEEGLIVIKKGKEEMI